MSIPERPAQLLLLQDSLIKLKDYEVGVKCTVPVFSLTCKHSVDNTSIFLLQPQRIGLVPAVCQKLLQRDKF